MKKLAREFYTRSDVLEVVFGTELKRLSGQQSSSEPHAELGTPTYNDMVVKASALALREHPRANGSYRDGRLQLRILWGSLVQRKPLGRLFRCRAGSGFR